MRDDEVDLGAYELQADDWKLVTQLCEVLKVCERPYIFFSLR